MIGAVLECCVGIDVGNQSVVVCLMTGPADGEAHEQTRRFGTNHGDLEKLREWLTNCGCYHVVMESTGAYWKPIFNVLEEVKEMQVILANSQQVKNLRGHKTDPNDSRWLAHLLRHGMIRPSYIPPRTIRDLRISRGGASSWCGPECRSATGCKQCSRTPTSKSETSSVMCSGFRGS